MSTPVQAFTSYHAKIIKSPTPDACWSWSAARTKAGYGVLRIRRGYYYAHRLSWEIHRGEIPHGLHVLHKCDNPKCSNPDHLFLGTQQDNVRDMIRKGRKNSTKGENHPTARLVAAQVIAIHFSTLPTPVLAKNFGIVDRHAYMIKAGTVWKHLWVAA